MFRFLMIAVFLAVTSAFQIQALSRRDFAKALATAPIGFAAAAFADGDNKYLGMGSSGKGAGNIEKYGLNSDVAIGRPGAAVDASGSKAVVGPGAPSNAIALGDTKTVANFPGPPGSEKTAAQVAAMARLMK